MSVVRISAVPEVTKPVEGVDYSVLHGEPRAGDPIRIRLPFGGELFSYHTPPSPPQSDTFGFEYPTDMEILMARLDVLQDKINALAAGA